ncbi:Angiogenic factor with G patch and FHA domains 1 [Smittium mucronatum]|uniref:Angiogenic factor with G patch and FHA domains 1 n=1 Tax=Smittium mucronatum TaxID=133383 RepID=A0A1R0GW30_9FUNG|nr:Angiogenic factor with G patch and FHA domains 1 [Smittium mucronatum]
MDSTQNNIESTIQNHHEELINEITNLARLSEIIYPDEKKAINEDGDNTEFNYYSTNNVPDGFYSSSDPQFYFNKDTGVWFDVKENSYSYFDENTQVYIPLEGPILEKVDNTNEQKSQKSENFLRLVVINSEALDVGSVIDVVNNELYFGREKNTSLNNYFRINDINTSKFHAHIFYDKKASKTHSRNKSKSKSKNDFHYRSEADYHLNTFNDSENSYNDGFKYKYKYINPEFSQHSSNYSHSDDKEIIVINKVSNSKASDFSKTFKKKHNNNKGLYSVNDIRDINSFGADENITLSKSSDNHIRETEYDNDNTSSDRSQISHQHRNYSNKRRRLSDTNDSYSSLEEGEMGYEKENSPILLDDEANTGFYIVDCGSTLGTYLNEHRISDTKRSSKPHSLLHMDIITIGNNAFKVHMHSDLPCSDCSLSKNSDLSSKSQMISSEPIIFGDDFSDEPQKISEKATSFSTELNRREELFRLKNKYKTNNKSKNIKSTGKSVSSRYIDRAQARRNYNSGVSIQLESPISSYTSSPDIAVNFDNNYGHSNQEGLNTHLSSDNKGYTMLSKMGWKKGKSLGNSQSGNIHPISVSSNLDRGGLGSGKLFHISVDPDLAKKASRKNDAHLLTRQRYNGST